jgi:hypothetical protein
MDDAFERTSCAGPLADDGEGRPAATSEGEGAAAGADVDHVGADGAKEARIALHGHRRGVEEEVVDGGRAVVEGRDADAAAGHAAQDRAVVVPDGVAKRMGHRRRP